MVTKYSLLIENIYQEISEARQSNLQLTNKSAAEYAVNCTALIFHVMQFSVDLQFFKINYLTTHLVAYKNECCRALMNSFMSRFILV